MLATPEKDKTELEHAEPERAGIEEEATAQETISQQYDELETPRKGKGDGEDVDYLPTPPDDPENDTQKWHSEDAG